MVQIGSQLPDAPGPDLLGLLIGSEGTLAVVTKAVVRILRKPESVQTLLAAFNSIAEAGAAVSDIIGAGIIPAAVEMMDAVAIRAAEAAVHPNFPPADTILIVELDGPSAEVRELFSIVEDTCRRAGATTIEVAPDETQRMRIWKGRKAAFAAMGRVSPNYYVQDGVVPRTKLPEVLGRIAALSRRSGLPIGNVFHAGDGNLHPLICYDERIPGQATLAEEVAGEILTYCVEAGGSITGEHGVGADKKNYMPRMFSDDDLDVMQKLRDAIDPRRLCNPGKVLPTPRLCGEVPGPYRQHPVEAAGLADRF
jgi:glycolate dehydrogenase FAD-linked subunit